MYYKTIKLCIIYSAWVVFLHEIIILHVSLVYCLHQRQHSTSLVLALLLMHLVCDQIETARKASHLRTI